MRRLIFALPCLLLACAAKDPVGATHHDVSITSFPTTAGIYLNGNYIGNTPLTVDVWYDRNRVFTEIIARNLYPNQFPQVAKITAPDVPDKIRFFMNHPSLVELDLGKLSGGPKQERKAREEKTPPQPPPKPPVPYVFFDYDSDLLSVQAQQAIDMNIAWLKAHADLALRLEGYGDERGSEVYNEALGMRRAHAVQRYMLRRGVDRGRLLAVSHSEAGPLRPGSGEQAWRYNRRVAFVPFRPLRARPH
ncbi:MAG: PEGA domain-containing protein [Zetaproteobacteria bacterium]|nr:MAG: PEGA domain-containing protein [Zetaproteobacteria bacterium]